MPLEFQEVPGLRAAPAVDALVIVADDADVAFLAGEQADQVELQLVRVLELIDHDLLEPPPPKRTRFRMFLQQLHGEEE